ncbi:MAG TPA: glycosyltransferase [Anaerolineales bacterium]|nr:glycosyltransferase [Anaerolineales bacterium]
MRGSVCLVVSGLQAANARLQPWRYLLEVGRGLARLGYGVTLLSDGSRAAQGEILSGLPLVRLPDVRLFPWRSSTPLESALEQIAPDVLLLNVGLTSFLHQDFRLWRRYPAIGVFTSPLYTLSQLGRIGLARLWRDRSLTAIHLLGALAPQRLLRKRLQNSGLGGLVVQTQTTRRQLVERGLWQGWLEVIPPGVDPDWSAIHPVIAACKRQELGYGPEDVVVAYFGSPAPLRGLPSLIRAVERARQKLPSLKLLALSRLRPGELRREEAWLKRYLSADGRGKFIHLIDGFLELEELVQSVAACDLVAVPFELVPSDAPLSALEAQALGKPLVTSDIACLPELAAGGKHYLVQPGDTESLASALEQAVSELQQNKQVSFAPVRSWQAVGKDWAQLLERL